MNSYCSRFAVLLGAASLIFSVAVCAQDDKPLRSTGNAGEGGHAGSRIGGSPGFDNAGIGDRGGERIDYTAIAGIITVGATDAQDAQLGLHGKPLAGSQLALSEPKDPADAPPVARMFYVAYFKKGAKAEDRPITFMYNGGPGSFDGVAAHGIAGSEACGYFKRHSFTRCALHDGRQLQLPARRERHGVHRYAGNGIRASRGQERRKGILGRGRRCQRLRTIRRAFPYEVWTLEFAEVHLWRKLWDYAMAVLANDLENNWNIDLNGVILLSQIFNFTVDIDQPTINPGSRSAVSTGAAHLRSDGVVSQEAAEPACRAGAAFERGGGLCDGGLRACVGAGNRHQRDRKAAGGGEAARLYRLARGLPVEGQSADHGTGV